MKTLPKLSEYVKRRKSDLQHLEKIFYYSECTDIANEFVAYSEFLTQPLNLSHFVPAIEKDGKWIVLDCPHNYGLLHLYPTGDTLMDASFECAIEYQTALDNVVFEGCGLMDGWCLQFADGTLFESIENLNKYTFEDLIPYNLEVNETIIKKFGL